MNETYVQVSGNVVADPDHRVTQTGAPFTTFRIASTIRRPVKDSNAYEDGPTSFYNVIAFRQLAVNTYACVRRGHPVTVYGRQRVTQFTREDGSTGTSVEIDALVIGHDLSRGTTTFSKGMRPKYDPRDRLSDPQVRSATEGWSTEYTTDDGTDGQGASQGRGQPGSVNGGPGWPDSPGPEEGRDAAGDAAGDSDRDPGLDPGTGPGEDAVEASPGALTRLP